MSDFWLLIYDDPIIWHQFEHDPAPLEEEVPQPEELGVSITDLWKSFGDREVLRGLSLDIEAGQFVSVVGRSGCGKSTLLRLIAGLETPDDGTIQTDADGKRGAIRIMFQEPRLLPWARIIRNVDIGLAGTEMQGRYHLARLALASVGLGDRAHDWPAALSGGQKQRVALARALINHPGLLLLDEPLGALDALTRIEMQSLLESMWLSRRFTAVLVTHEVAEAIALSDRVIPLEHGRIAEDVWIDLPRARRRGDTRFAALEQHLLERLLRR
ncbi:MAG: ATP-binding cassette domain-containing protein [Acetobacteraceae bacterium]|nr:ATP-binding cassette domain-containing protein [Acetobacteraceae bacterium]